MAPWSLHPRHVEIRFTPQKEGAVRRSAAQCFEEASQPFALHCHALSIQRLQPQRQAVAVGERGESSRAIARREALRGTHEALLDEDRVGSRPLTQ